MTTTAEATVGATPEEKQQALTIAVADQARQGWEVVSQSPTQTQLAKGKPTNHVLHLLLSVFTLGLWIPVWILVAIFGGRKTKLLTVDAAGIVHGA